jgi:hypothetical protein
MLDISTCLLHIKNGFSIILWPGLFKGKKPALTGNASSRHGRRNDYVLLFHD